nr:proline/serine-rich coiled-coil protein 1 isoform X1 [Pogona vitticeps]XP_020660945.1 proline/serine-rich coiled-coil protein 1 isoform X1 [Pogona vitticeps]XP_020660946.1 proline/serine-rich coiled-coil protein 1 isoform X1 [Pogona vitticeps]XP_020660947.1 proline/serine-rich coiled-coil protein 1 isoform X1 [Pogona vitticeps]
MELSNEDITFITEETLEFGLLVPLDGQEEEDSAISTVEPGERCVAQAIDMNILLGESESKGREQPSQWSPLSPEKLEEVRKEANMLAEQLERCRLLEKENGSHETRLPVVPELALLPPTGCLHGGRPSPRNPRRKTFNVNNSPLKALLPTVGPETSLAYVSPKARFPKGRSPSSCIVDVPSPKRLQSKSQVFNADSQLAKKAGPSRLFKASTATKSGTRKPQAPNRNSKKEMAPRVTISSATHAQESLQHLKPFPQITNRRPLGKSKGASTSNLSAENAQDPSNKGRKLVTDVEAKPRPSPVKKCLAFPKKVVSPHKAEQSGFKVMGSDGCPLQAFSKPCGTTNQIQTRCMATSGLASQLPVPRATGRGVTSGRQAVPGRPSQLKSLGMPGRQGSAVPTGKKASTFQQTVPCGTPQKSRLRLPKKTVSVNSK